MIKIAIVATVILFFGAMINQEISGQPELGVAMAPSTLNAKAIPPWVDNVMKFYVNGDISEREMLDAFDFLFKNNIMHMSQEAAQQVSELREENKKLHHQLAQYRESDFDFAQRMQEQAMHQNAPDSWDGSDDPGRFDQAQNLGPQVMQKKHITNVAAVPMIDDNGVETRVLVSIPDGVDPNTFVQMVLRESYMETNKDLQFYAEKVRYFNDMKEAMRDHISQMRSMHADMMMKSGEEIHTDEYGRVKVQFPWMSSEESIKQHISEMKKSIDSLPPERQQAAISSLRTLVSSQAMSGTSGTGGDITMQGGSGTSDGSTSYDKLTMKADLDEHEGTISKFLVLQKELESTEHDIEELTRKIDSAMVLQKTLKKDLILLEDVSVRAFPTKVALSNGVNVLESQEHLEKEIKKLEGQLSSIGDDAQLANIDLQNALQKQQQTLQTMSNVSKMLHDTAMAIIRKIG